MSEVQRMAEFVSEVVEVHRATRASPTRTVTRARRGTWTGDSQLLVGGHDLC